MTTRLAHPRGFDLAIARRALVRAEPRFAPWLRRIEAPAVRWHEPFDPVDALARAILYQQLSGKAAATIVGRVETLLGARRLRAEALAAVPTEALRGCGVSGNKALALKDLAAKAAEGVVPRVGTLRWLSDAEIIERLTAVRGIGRWTVEMMLMFRLGRPDVLPVDDLGVRKGAQILLGLPEMPTPKWLAAHGEAWAPYRTLAALWLWRIVDANAAGRAPVVRSQG